MPLPPHIRKWFGSLGATKFLLTKEDLDAHKGQHVNMVWRTESSLFGHQKGILTGNTSYAVGDDVGGNSVIFKPEHLLTEVAIYLK